ncbi:hypothetical protein H5410_042798 [Solanum commersonii]|uniref:Uncharacterized protein n=1 Tax=Solanum commersonii TaxID=4109 RepID=A0A9J5XYQ1_SOLCO|nr:hypothetical protein H5410_042798 [Solanum commersonii]
MTVYDNDDFLCFSALNVIIKFLSILWGWRNASNSFELSNFVIYHEVGMEAIDKKNSIFGSLTMLDKKVSGHVKLLLAPTLLATLSRGSIIQNRISRKATSNIPLADITST